MAAKAETGLDVAHELNWNRLRRVFLALALGTLLGNPSAAQVADPSGAGSPPPPPGEGTLRGTVVHPDGPAHTAGLYVQLYSLLPDGREGAARSPTDAHGSFAFEGLSTDPDVLYVVGTHYKQIAFSQRASFSPGQRELRILLRVSEPRGDASTVRDEVEVVQSVLQLSWLGASVVVRERQLLRNTSPFPLHVASDDRQATRALFRAELPAAARDFIPRRGDRESFSRDGTQIYYWGPLDPGNQEIQYEYRVPAESQELNLRRGFPDGTQQLHVLFASGMGLRVDSDQLQPDRDIVLADETYRNLNAEALTPGSQVELSIELPQTQYAPDALSLGAAHLRVELDDTVLQVIQEHRIRVMTETPVMGRSEAPLLHFESPADAELAPLPAAAADMGIRAGARGGIDVLGPLMPGEHDISWQYRIPTRNGSARLDLRFPQSLPVLDMRVADTGVIIEGERFHRLRPRTLGTRTYLLNRTRDVAAGETLSIRFQALENSSWPQGVALALVLAFAALAILVVTAPLRPRAGSAASRARGCTPSTLPERDLLCATIRDLNHDFETEKIGETDYQQTRAALLGRLVALMQAEPHPAGAPSGKDAAASVMRELDE